MSLAETGKKKESDGQLPPVGVNVIVQCDGYRCLAHRTRDGKWVTTFSNIELKNVIRVLPY